MNESKNNLNFCLLSMLMDYQLLSNLEKSDKKIEMDRLRDEYISKMEEKKPNTLNNKLEQQGDESRDYRLRTIRDHFRNFILSYGDSEFSITDIGRAFIEGLACGIDEVRQNISTKKVDELFDNMTFDCYRIFKEFEDNVNDRNV